MSRVRVPLLAPPFPMTDERIAGLVLAGGAARRMGGGDKPLLEVGGQPMLARVIAALGVTPIAISANGDPARFAEFGLPVLPDGDFAGQGPLAGGLAGYDMPADGTRRHADASCRPGGTPAAAALLSGERGTATLPGCSVAGLLHDGVAYNVVHPRFASGRGFR
jgi:molybdenum cofactor guanylyltransferase